MNVLVARTAFLLAAVLAVGAAASAGGLAWRLNTDDAQALASQTRSIAEIEAELKLLEARISVQPDWTVIAATVEPSVLTISTDGGLGSGWVVHADATGSDLITNFHVVEDAVVAGVFTVDVRQLDRTMRGTIVRIDRNDDLAVVRISARFSPLGTVVGRPQLGATVMVVGSPLGLGGTVSIGVVSGFRSLWGSDYVQFSAPISPGNSGGPVVDRKGRVVAIATAKLVGSGVEALGLAIPVQIACAALVDCTQV